MGKLRPGRRVICFVVFLLAGQLVGAEHISNLDDQKSLAVTIYNEDLAMVKDQRELVLQKGNARLAFREVSAQIRPETALLKNIGNASALRVLEQNFDFDLLSPGKLLEKYVGQQIAIATMNPATGVEKTENATLLSTNAGVVVKFSDRIETNPSGRMIFPDVPANLRDRPTLVTQIESDIGGPQVLELSYLTSGLSWQADYVAELSSNEKTLDLQGWVTLTNKSGTDYPNAITQLVAGDLNRVAPKQQGIELMRMATMMDSAVPAEEGLFEYHLYSLPRKTTIANNQTKQVSLLTAAKVPVVKELLLLGSPDYYQGSYGEIGQQIKVAVFLEFVNDEKSNLGLPLPQGTLRVYKKDSKGNAQFIGEDRIDHRPKKEKIRLKLGAAFDVTGHKVQTSYKKLSALGRYTQAHESGYRIELKNAKSEPVTVTVREPVPGDWEIVEESHPHEKVAAGIAEWRLKIPAEGSSTLTYSALVRF